MPLISGVGQAQVVAGQSTAFHETAQGVRYTISEDGRRELLTRLLMLNYERYAEEVRLGLHEKKQRGEKGDGQMSLL